MVANWGRAVAHGALAGAVLGGVAAFWVACSPSPGDEPLEFTPAAWAAAGTTCPEDRQRMVDDLLRRETLVGLDRVAVVRLLGAPTAENWSETYPHPGWDCGLYGGSFGDSTGLIVSFGADGLADRVWAPWSARDRPIATRGTPPR